MRKWMLGFSFGVILSLIGTIVVSFFSTYFAGYGKISITLWYFYVSCIFLSLGYASISYLFAEKNMSKKQLHSLNFIYSFILLVLSCSIGPIMVESFKRDISTINLSGYFIWGFFYALILLPIILFINNFIFTKFFKMNTES